MVNPESEAAVAQQPYREVLRPIGAFLDSVHARNVVLAEIDGGFLWTYHLESDPLAAKSATISFEDLPKLREHIQRAKTAVRTEQAPEEEAASLESALLPMFPNGYEERLRSLGAKLDSQYARQVQMLDNGQDMLVRFVLSPPAYMRRTQPDLSESLQFREEVYSAEETAELIAVSRSRRGSKYFY